MKKISIGTQLTAGGSNVVYTVPAGYRASWTLFYCINNTSSSKTITCTWHDASTGQDIHIFSNYPISAKNYIMFDSGAWVMMNVGDTVTVSAESGADAYCINSFEVENVMDDFSN